MPDMEARIAELFGFQRFEQNEKLQGMIDTTLQRYEKDESLSADELAAAAGGIKESPAEDEGSGKK